MHKRKHCLAATPKAAADEFFVKPRVSQRDLKRLERREGNPTGLSLGRDSKDAHPD